MTTDEEDNDDDSEKDSDEDIEAGEKKVLNNSIGIISISKDEVK